MSNCSLNTECRCDSLVAAIDDVISARDEDSKENFLIPEMGVKFFRLRYPRLSDAIDHAAELIHPTEEEESK